MRMVHTVPLPNSPGTHVLPAPEGAEWVDVTTTKGPLEGLQAVCLFNPDLHQAQHLPLGPPMRNYAFVVALPYQPVPDEQYRYLGAAAGYYVFVGRV